MAIAAVMAFHAGVPGAAAGWLGVDLFFALSGFLITTLICNEIALTGRFDFAYFWIRRGLRIFPPYYAYVAGITAAAWMGFGTLSPHHGYTPDLWTASLWCYFVNYIPQGGIWTGQMLTLHLWSLAVEEQFYAFWPLCFVLFKRLRSLLITSIVLVLIVLTIRTRTSASIDKLLYTRGLPLFLGCVTSLLIATFRLRSTRTITNLSFIVSAAFTAAISIALITHRLSEPEAHRALVPFAATSYALMVGCIWTCPQGWICRVLSTRPLVYVGKISYGIYLYHMAVHELIWRELMVSMNNWPSTVKFPLRLGSYIAVSIAVAAVSHRYFEQPFLSLKDRFRRRERQSIVCPNADELVQSTSSTAK